MNKICQNCKYHYIEEISFNYPQSCCNRTNPHYTTEAGLHCDNFEYSENYIKKQLEAYENMRKEAIGYMKEFTFEPLLVNEDRKLIMYNENLKNFENILNKVGGSDE